MQERREVKKQRTYRISIWFFWSAFFIGMLCGGFFVLLIEHPLIEIEQTRGNNTFFMPTTNQIRAICNDIGFDGGWLSNINCGQTEVMCYYKIGEITRNKCVEANK